MKTPLERVRTGAAYLGVVLILAYCGYLIAGYSWIEALWAMTVTISTVGYSETSTSDPVFQLFTVAVILFGMTAVAYTFGGFVQMMLEGEIANALGQRRLTGEIDKLKDHVVVCGFGRIGQVLAQDLAKQGRPFVVIENDPEMVNEAIERKHFLCLMGDATDEDLLTAAGIERARSLISALSNDAANVFITLTARDMNKNLFIVSRAEHRSTERKLRQAGADRIVMPAIIGAHQMERLITRPTTADLMELLAESTYLDVEMDEVEVLPGGRIENRPLQELNIFRQHRLLVIAVRKRDGSMMFNPPPTYEFASGEVIVVLGHLEDIGQFQARVKT